MNYQKLIKLANIALDQYINQDLLSEDELEQDNNWINSNIKNSYKEIGKTYNLLNKIKHITKNIYKDSDMTSDIQDCLYSLNAAYNSLNVIAKIANLKLEPDFGEVILEIKPDKIINYIDKSYKSIEESFDRLTEVKWFMTTVEPDNEMIKDIDLCLSNLESALDSISFINSLD